jgi:hypothetical protein
MKTNLNSKNYYWTMNSTHYCYLTKNLTNWTRRNWKNCYSKNWTTIMTNWNSMKTRRSPNSKNWTKTDYYLNWRMRNCLNSKSWN